MAHRSKTYSFDEEVHAALDVLRIEHGSINAGLRVVLLQRPPTSGLDRASRKLSKAAQAAEARRAEDPGAQAMERTDIDYMNPDELPSGGSVGAPSDAKIKAEVKFDSINNWRAGRKPLLKPSDKKPKK